ncbi:SGNH/GDSL hydrolase family protein [Ancylomarina sp. 16SWW S1-10-2]|uniref:SGNH/GDSL hydrolase family protein n=1 Tax=Ancylomarina sp. 16SWW S1-10-2 TaxID=2499681 RepID=UPI0012AD96F8|nr:SGNH/GDSL hydrolase family protein [Ancylomarina sp. 16SWW S1-10-2]MRT93797.1 SGNH/GDSL hydrolase family protein [Ancylomarina sp. 16SWW S1-10-2]
MKKLIIKYSFYILPILFTLQSFAQGDVSSVGKKVTTELNDNVNLIRPNNDKIAYNGVLFSVVTETQAELHRYSKDYFDFGMDGTIDLTKARTQPGVSISFKTNSPIVKLKFANLENSSIRKKKFTVFQNGVLAYDNIFDLEFTIANPAKDTTEWEVYLPNFSGVKFLGLELTSDFVLYDIPDENKPLYMAIGNSITHGVGQPGTIESYPYKVANALGFRHVNLATGGSRISDETVRNFNDVSPRLITILWGYNDVNQEKTLLEVMPEYDSLVSRLCTKLPQTDIYCILQTFTTTVVGRKNDDNRIDSLRNWTSSIVKKLQKKYSNLYLIDGVDYVTSEADLKDQVHLNIQGAEKLAKGIVNEYKANNCSQSDKDASKNR